MNLSKPYQLGLVSASCIVISNMIGTGVFTSLGYQVMDIHSVFALVMLWVVGGLVAFCGAIVYAELGSRFPQSGGEYHLLSKIYHPLPGFLSGWVSAVAGFAAPTALAAIAFGKYIHVVFPYVSDKVLALILVITFTGIHSSSVRLGTKFQDFFTVLKVAVILLFITLAFVSPHHESISIAPQSSDWSEVFQGTFAVNLVYVSFAFTGWNASIYVVGEIKNPEKNLPRSLLLGTGMVTVLYAILNYVFLYAVPQTELAGKLEIGHIAATRLFGTQIGDIVSITIAILMVSTVSVMVFIGPRVIYRIGEDFSSLSYFNRKSERHVPVRAVLLQGSIMVLFIVTSSFEQVLVYAAFSLILITMLTVSGIFVARYRWKNVKSSYSAFGYPFTPLLFLLVNAAILLYVFLDRPLESTVGVGIILLGIPVYYLVVRRNSR